MANYYIDYANGDDNNNGSINAPFKTVQKVNSITPSSGDVFYFKRGQQWRFPLTPKSNAEYTSYGDTTLPMPLILGSIPRNSTSDWTNVSGNLWSCSMDYYDGTPANNQLSTNNSTFETDVSGYQTYSGGTASFTVTKDTAEFHSGAASMKIAVTDHSSAQSHVVVATHSSNNVMSLKKWYMYEFTFWAKASSGFTIPEIYIQQPFGSNYYYTGYGRHGHTPTITTSWAQYRVVFISNVTASDCRINFQLGGASGVPNGANLWLDDLSFKELGAAGIFSQIPSPYTPDVGHVWVNGSTMLADKQSSSGACTSQGQYYSDTTNYQLIMYSTSNPATYYPNGIELAIKNNGCNFSSITGAYVHGIEFSHFGGHGSNMDTCTSCKFNENLVHHIGGAYLTGTTRYGNGLQYWLTNTSNNMDKNVVYECFDVGSTAQGDSASAYTIDGCTFMNNTIYNCEQSFEIWGKTHASTVISNFKFEGNTCLNAGSGYSRNVRPTKIACHVLTYTSTATITNVSIQYNTFDTSLDWIYRISESFANIKSLTVDNNIIKQSKNKYIARKTDYVFFDMGEILNYKNEWGFDKNSSFIVKDYNFTFIET